MYVLSFGSVRLIMYDVLSMTLKKNCYIAISGVMGSGKTTFSKSIAMALGASLFEEKANENPYLADYYRDPHTWAFASQHFYLETKIAQLHEIKKAIARSSVVQDTPVYQDCFSYARAQVHLGYMTEADYMRYLAVFTSEQDLLPVPHLIVYLQAPLEVLEKRIQERSRGFEQSVDRAYLGLLLDLQNEWIETHAKALNILTVPIDNDARDLIKNEDYWSKVLGRIQQALV